MNARSNTSREVAERAARDSYGKLVAFLAARSRDVAAAEDALSDAFAAALETWPQRGVPDNPEAWLMTTAKRRLIDEARKKQVRNAAADHLKLAADEAEALAREAAAQGRVPDERLGLLLACAHPAIDEAARAPLMLQAVLGLDAARIASAFLVAPAAMAQRLVRAKRKIRDAGIPFAPPDRDAAPARIASALQAVYAAYTEGWGAGDPADAAARELSHEALFLARLLAQLAPDEPEALGLLALMLHLEARRAARRDAHGDFVPLDAQDTTLWSSTLIAEAEAQLTTAAAARAPGRFQLEAAIQSAHAERRHDRSVNWRAIVALYDQLLALTGSPVVAVNRAAAVGQAVSADAGLEALAQLDGSPRLATYQPYWAAKAHLLARAGRADEARDSYARAAALTPDQIGRAHV